MSSGVSRSNITIPEADVAEAWSEFRYPRAGLDEPSEGFMRAIRALNTRLPFIVAAELQRLINEAFPSEDSPYLYGCEELLHLVQARAAELRGGAQ